MNVHVECEQEVDGRWFAEVPELPGVLTYGYTANEALSKIQVLAANALAEQIEHVEARPQSMSFTIPVK